MPKKTKKIKKKIRFKRVLIVLVIIALIIYLFSILFKLPIKNIIVKGNSFISDQEIIDLIGISNYPPILKINKNELEKKLQKNSYIKKAKIKRNIYREVIIKIEENKPLFYDLSKEKTILSDGSKLNKMLNLPILVNYVPDTIYNNFVSKMSDVDESILNKISEIKYDPNTVDEERFLLFMSDQNKVYLTLNKFDKINKYNGIMANVLAKYENKKGVLYLDEGEYFVLNK